MRHAVVIPSYNGSMRAAALLRSIAAFDPGVFKQTAITVVHDPDPADRTQHMQYEKLRHMFPWVELVHLNQWSNMHGSAQQAFELVISRGAEWVVYLGDDLLVTPGALSNMLTFLERNPLDHISLVQFPYWNAHELCPKSYSEHQGPELLSVKDDMYSLPIEWVKQVPRNHHWDGSGRPRMYINVNGAGFACKASTFVDVGGFAEGTWCLDESISLKVWRDTEDQMIVTLPGPPLVHFFGGATLTNPQPHQLHTEEAWIAAMGVDKKGSAALSYGKMDALRELAIGELDKLRVS